MSFWVCCEFADPFSSWAFSNGRRLVRCWSVCSLFVVFAGVSATAVSGVAVATAGAAATSAVVLRHLLPLLMLRWRCGGCRSLFNVLLFSLRRCVVRWALKSLNGDPRDIVVRRWRWTTGRNLEASALNARYMKENLRDITNGHY